MSSEERVEIVALESITPEFAEALRRIIAQLGPDTPIPSDDHLAAVVNCKSNILLAARVNHRTVGTLTLAMLITPSGTIGWIADVVVDNEVRGKGIGEKLVRHAIEVAAGHGARYVDLSSRPARTVANRLYQRLGFEKRDTNYYRYRLEAE